MQDGLEDGDMWTEGQRDRQSEAGTHRDARIHQYRTSRYSPLTHPVAP